MKKLSGMLLLLTLIYCCEKNAPPSCAIITPSNGSEINKGELINVSVDALDPDGSIHKVRVYIDSFLLETDEEFPYQFYCETDELKIGGHVIRAVAIDDNNLEAEASIEIEIIDIPVDEKDPVVQLISPIEDAVVKGTIQIMAKAMDEFGVDYVDFMIQDEDWSIFDKDSTPADDNEYSAILKTKNYPDGLITLAIEAYDSAGNSGKFSFNLRINNSGDNKAPIVEILEPQNNQTVSGRIRLKAMATDNIGISQVIFKVFNNDWIFLGADNSPTEVNKYAILWDTKSIPGGSYEIEVAAYDSVANEGFDRIRITIDNSGVTGEANTFFYEGREYNYTTIGKQTWMIENLAYLPSVFGAYRGSDTTKIYYVYGFPYRFVDEAKRQDNYSDYGVIYNWPAAMNACPPGWHLPSDEEWKTLEKHLGMNPSDADRTGMRNSGEVGQDLKSISGWVDNGNGENSSGFNALPGGYRNIDGEFKYLGYMANFWTSSKIQEGNVIGRHLDHNSYGVYRSSYTPAHGASVRCIKDE